MITKFFTKLYLLNLVFIAVLTFNDEDINTFMNAYNDIDISDTDDSLKKIDKNFLELLSKIEFMDKITNMQETENMEKPIKNLDVNVDIDVIQSDSQFLENETHLIDENQGPPFYAIIKPHAQGLMFNAFYTDDNITSGKKSFVTVMILPENTELNEYEEKLNWAQISGDKIENQIEKYIENQNKDNVRTNKIIESEKLDGIAQFYEMQKINILIKKGSELNDKDEYATFIILVTELVIQEMEIKIFTDIHEISIRTDEIDKIDPSNQSNLSEKKYQNHVLLDYVEDIVKLGDVMFNRKILHGNINLETIVLIQEKIIKYEDDIDTIESIELKTKPKLIDFDSMVELQNQEINNNLYANNDLLYKEDYRAPWIKQNDIDDDDNYYYDDKLREDTYAIAICIHKLLIKNKNILNKKYQVYKNIKNEVKRVVDAAKLDSWKNYAVNSIILSTNIIEIIENGRKEINNDELDYDADDDGDSVNSTFKGYDHLDGTNKQLDEAQITLPVVSELDTDQDDVIKLPQKIDKSQIDPIINPNILETDVSNRSETEVSNRSETQGLNVLDTHKSEQSDILLI